MVCKYFTAVHVVSERGFAFRGHKESFERRSISRDMAVQSVLSLSGISPAHPAVASKPQGKLQVRRQYGRVNESPSFVA